MYWKAKDLTLYFFLRGAVFHSCHFHVFYDVVFGWYLLNCQPIERYHWLALHTYSDNSPVITFLNDGGGLKLPMEWNGTGREQNQNNVSNNLNQKAKLDSFKDSWMKQLGFSPEKQNAGLNFYCRDVFWFFLFVIILPCVCCGAIVATAAVVFCCVRKQS